jgi:alpha-N-acetylglucosaminidase
MLIDLYRLRAAAMLLVLAALTSPAVGSAGFDVRAVEGVLQRLLPQYARELRAIEPDNAGERFRISRAGDHVRVEGSTPSALLFNWYLKYLAQLQISPNGDQLGTGRPGSPAVRGVDAALVVA